MLEPRVYTCTFSGVAITATQDLFNITPATNKPCYILGLSFTQTTDFGDAQDEVLRWQIIRGNTTAGSAGGTVNPRPVRRSDAAAGFTCRANDTTPAASGTPVTMWEDGFNVRAGDRMFWTPETAVEVTQADTICAVRLAVAPVDSITISATLVVGELG